ncbi:MAG: D-2-hydroxyacid dehydrogenase [Pseudomonadota bacterium]
MSDKPTILLHNRETQSLVEMLLNHFPKALVRTCGSYEALPGVIEDFRPEVVYSVKFAGNALFPRKALLGPHGPRWIANGGVGTDHYGTWNMAQTTITNAAGVASGMMAEYILGGFLHFSLDVPGLQADKSDRRWKERFLVPLEGKTLLIIGLGHTGKELAKRAKAFGMNIIGTRARPQKMAFVDEVHAATDLPELLPRADYIAVAVPLIAQTRGLIGAEEIALMKPGVVFADVSRGGVVDQTALLKALSARQVAGAALDVFETEPLPQDSPLWSLDNVILSPHCSSVHADWETASFRLFLDNLGRWTRGEKLVNIVDPSRGY